jgi:RND superfamily putative drug exporter
MDAFLIRMAIVPALMFLTGKANWWFPKWLDRVLPHVAVDPDLPGSTGPDDAPPAPVEPEPVSA